MFEHDAFFTTAAGGERGRQGQNKMSEVVELPLHETASSAGLNWLPAAEEEEELLADAEDAPLDFRDGTDGGGCWRDTPNWNDVSPIFHYS